MRLINTPAEIRERRADFPWADARNGAPSRNRTGKALRPADFKSAAVSICTKDLADISFRKRHKFAAFQPNKFKGSEFIAEHGLAQISARSGHLRSAFCVSGSLPAMIDLPAATAQIERRCLSLERPRLGKTQPQNRRVKKYQRLAASKKLAGTLAACLCSQSLQVLWRELWTTASSN